MILIMTQNFDGAKIGEEIEVDAKRGIYLQSMGAAHVVKHDLPGARAKALKMAETTQSQAIKAALEKDADK